MTVEVSVVACILVDQHGKIGLEQRSRAVRDGHGSWSCVTGFLDEEDPLSQIIAELTEELALTCEKILRFYRGRVFTVTDGTRRIWRVFPYLGVLDSGLFAPRLNWESTSFAWFTADEIPEQRTSWLGAVIENCCVERIW